MTIWREMMTDHYQQNINRSNSKQMWEELCRGYHLTQIKKGSFVALLVVIGDQNAFTFTVRIIRIGLKCFEIR